MTQLIIDENPLLIAPKLATIIGLNEAIVLQQIHYWVNIYKQTQDGHHLQEGEWWVWNTGTEWQENFPFWSESTVRRVLDSLRKPYESKKGDKKVSRGPLVLVGNFNRKGYDQTLWYRVDYQEVKRLESILSKWVNGPSQVAKMDVGNVSKPIPETTQETTRETAPKVADFPLDKPEEIRYNETTILDYEMVDETDSEIGCDCGENIVIAQLSNSRAECPGCFRPVRVKNWYGKVIKKPSQKVRKKEKGFDGNVDRFDDKPLRAFCVLAGYSYDGMEPKQRKQWGYQLQSVAVDSGADAELTYQALRSFPDSEYKSWFTVDVPYNKKFQEILTALIMRQKSPEPQEKREVTVRPREVSTAVPSFVTRWDEE